MHIYVVAIIISLVLMAILFFALRSTVKRIDYNTKKYFIEKLQDYDYLINEKQKKLDELNEKIDENKKILNENANNDNIEKNVEKFEHYENLDSPKYMDENLFKKYKEIKQKFSFNKVRIISEFISDKVNDSYNSDYNILLNIRQKLTKRKIYEIMTLRKNEQIKYMYNFFSDEEINVIKKFISFENLKVSNIIIELETLIEKNNPVIYVYTGDKNETYSDISPLIKTKYDETINEGIKIKYKGILYDYSI